MNPGVKKPILLILAGALSATAVWAYWPMMQDPSLTFKWEGFLASKINFRDAGSSVNECLGQDVLPSGALLRSSHFFSGWSCDSVGNPDEIYSLDTFPDDGRKFYCRTEDGLRIGKALQVSEMSDLEFLKTWREKPEFVSAACRNLSGALRDIESGKKVLIQCEAGRDRTGAVTALLAAFLIEKRLGKLDDSAIAALECDYRKSKSIKEYKYGRIEAFLRDVTAQYGSVTAFLETQCAL